MSQKRPVRIALSLIVSFAFLVIALVVIMTMRGYIGRPELYEFSPGFRGWFVIEYGKANCPALTNRGVSRVIRVPQSGRLCTCNEPINGWQYTRYMYVGQDGTRHEIPSSDVPWGYYVQERKTEVLFLGTEQEMRNSWGSRPRVSSTTELTEPEARKGDKE